MKIDQPRPLGLSTGCLNPFISPYDPEAPVIIAQQGLSSIEIICAWAEHVRYLPALVPLVSKFTVKTLHLPFDIQYDNNREVRNLLRLLSEFYQAVGASLAIVHPDLVNNWNIFKGRPMRLAVENMDNQKQHYRMPEDFIEFFSKYPDWFLTLDLSHCFSNDSSLALVGRFTELFTDRIAEIHLSGHSRGGSHTPLYIGNQKEIIDSLPPGDCPIIIESPFKNIRELRLELAYIRRYLKI